jgi:multidrug efflux pump subunit AcrA (membrane-fusion protein)
MKPVHVTTGVTDEINTEIKQGLKVGDEVVTEIKTIASKVSSGSDDKSSSPFMPKRPDDNKKKSRPQ